MNRISSKIDRAYQEYLSSGNQLSGFYDLALSFIGWKILSEQAAGDNNPWELKPPDTAFFFDIVLKQPTGAVLKQSVQAAWGAWESNNPMRLNGMLKVDDTLISSMPDDYWKRFCDTWVDLFRYCVTEIERTNLLDSVASLIAAENREFMTPKEVVSAMVGLSFSTDATSLYDPYCRSADLLFAAAKKSEKIKGIVGTAAYRLNVKLGTFRLAMLHQEIRKDTGINRDLLLSVRPAAKFDYIIMNPPFGAIQHNNVQPEVDGEWYDLVMKSNRMELGFICHALSHLSEKGTATIIVPSIILSGQGVMKELRTRIIQKNILDVVVSLPQGIFPNTGVSTAILVFRMNRQDDHIAMLDASEPASRNNRQAFLDEGLVNNFIVQYQEGKISNNQYQRIITTAEVTAKDFDFRLALYNDDKQSAVLQSVPSEVIQQECEALEEKLQQVRAQIEKLLAGQ